MNCSLRRIFDGLAIALLMYGIVGLLWGAVRGAARLPSIAIACFCGLCVAGLFQGLARVRMATGCFFILVSVCAVLVSWRLRASAVTAILLCSAFLIVGVGLIAQSITRKTTPAKTQKSKPVDLESRLE